MSGPPAGTPFFAQYVLDVRVKIPVGFDPDSSELQVVDTDDARRFTVTLSLAADQRLSVPAGHYAIMALANYPTTDAAGNSRSTLRIAFAVNQVVRGPDTTTARVDLSKATNARPAPIYKLPRRAHFVSQDTIIYLGDRAHHNAGTGIDISPDPTLTTLVQPLPGRTPGLTTADQSFYSVGGDAPRIVYDLTRYHADRLVLGEHIDVAKRDLATITSDVYADTADRSAAFGENPDFGTFDLGNDTRAQLPAGRQRVDYVFGSPSTRWIPSFSVDTSGGGGVGGFAPEQNYRSAHSYHQDYLRGPLTPGVADVELHPKIYPASRTDRHLSAGISEITDSETAHTAQLFAQDGHTAPTTHTTIYRDGTVLLDGDNYRQPLPGYFSSGTPATADVSPAASRYRIVDTTDGAGAGLTLSTHAVSDYRFDSSATSGKTVPDSACIAPGTGCTVLPLLTTRVPLPTDINDTMPVGTHTFIVTIGHIHGASPDRIRSLTFAISDDGAHFRRAVVTALGEGRYRVSLTNLADAHSHSVTTRLAATDVNGSSLTQTVTAAYRTGGAATGTTTR